MNILVLGGTGFLGRYLVEELIQNQYDVTVLTRNPEKLKIFSRKISYIKGDLLNYKDINFSGYTHIVNCSGELKKEELMQIIHVDCIAGILNQIKEKGLKIHWVHVSSVGVYGQIREGVVREETPFAPVGQYEITKAEGDMLVKQFCLANNINYTILRPSNVFGVGMPNQSLVHLILMIKKNLFFYIGKNTGNITMNYIPVEDVANLIVLCLNNSRSTNQEFNISDQLFLNDFVEIICKELKVKRSFYSAPEGLLRFLSNFALLIPKLPLTQTRINALTMRTTYTSDKVHRELDYISKIGITLGLKNYVFDLISRLK